ncbi:4-hydroxy-tetrahydrodipicolinate synthase [hydrothermal vent metagenome]|uniref:4-hydroxy-tetrahydrodipicolinate synthase n=1 Tax=hydrothermal vent metagenome TaxID=652676 RepID=A0A3B0ZZC6_9ZZZZ
MFQGSLVALVTPMSDDGSVDYDSLRSLIEFHVENGTDAIIAMGTTGESATLSQQEHCEVIRQAVDFSNKRVPVIAGTGANSTTEAIALTQCALQAGADACLLVTPYYNKPTQQGLYLHYKAIAEAVAIPQILYNVPGRTAVDMLPETIKQLASISNIIGVKEATGDMARIKTLVSDCPEDFYVWSGDDATALEAIFLGAKGDISVTANVAPKLMHEMCLAALHGQRDTATEINQRLMPLHEKLFVEANPIPVKWALMEMAKIPKGIRLPLTLLSSEFHETVRSALKNADVL